MSQYELNSMNFSDFMEKYNIIMPLIQREYAQGRDNEAGEEIRKTFIPELIAVLTGEKTELELDFVFGKINGNGFIPLDGQQRLTTLLLLHWYFGRHETQWEFTYKSRRMANSFVRGLLSSDGYKGDKMPSKWIEKQEWFFENWQTDPTVSGMLTMLDAIHYVVLTCREKKKECYPEKLENISFFIHPIFDELNADNVYTKMNARGEPLTEWENIKALLDKKANDLCLKDSPITCPHNRCAVSAWTKCINIDWLQCLEGYAKLDELPSDFDEEALVNAISKINCGFQNIFDLAVCIDLATRKIACREEDEVKKRKEMEVQQEETKNKIQMFLGHKALLSDYDKIVTWHTFELATSLFNTLLNRKSILNDGWSLDRSKNKFWGDPVDPDTSLFSEEFLFKKDYTYKDCSRFYAISRLDSNDDSTAPRWIRVIWNIIENGSDIYVDNFPKVINLIDQLAPYSGNIIKYLAENEIQCDFAKDQLHEECDKAKKVNENPEEEEKWEDKIKKAEKYAFFRGCIRFLYRDANNEPRWSDFDTKFANVKKYFSSDGNIADDYKSGLLLQALVVILPTDEWVSSVINCSFNNEPETWLKLLTKKQLIQGIHHLLLNRENLRELVKNRLVSSTPFVQNLAAVIPIALERWNPKDQWHVRGEWSIQERYMCTALTKYGQRRSLPAQKDWLLLILDERVDRYLNDARVTIVNESRYNLDLVFEFGGHCFMWWGVPNDNETDVYLLESCNTDDPAKRSKPLHETTLDVDNYYCTPVSSPSVFFENLNNLITEYTENESAN